MKHYEIEVNDTLYNVIISQKSSNTLENDTSSDNPAFECVKAEYEHCIERSEKLDNKINIALTVCALLFVLISDTLGKFSSFHFPNCTTQLYLIITYSIIMSFTIYFYSYSLINLTRLLRGIKIKRIEPMEVFDKNLIESKSLPVQKYISGKYIQCLHSNNQLLEDKFKKYNKCVNYLLPVIFLSFLLILTSNFIK